MFLDGGRIHAHLLLFLNVLGQFPHDLTNDIVHVFAALRRANPIDERDLLELVDFRHRHGVFPTPILGGFVDAFIFLFVSYIEIQILLEILDRDNGIIIGNFDFLRGLVCDRGNVEDALFQEGHHVGA